MHAELINHVLLFTTLCTVIRQAALSMGFPRQESWSGLLFPSLGDLPDPGIELASPLSPVSAGRFSTMCHPGIPQEIEICKIKPLTTSEVKLTSFRLLNLIAAKRFQLGQCSLWELGTRT